MLLQLGAPSSSRVWPDTFGFSPGANSFKSTQDSLFLEFSPVRRQIHTVVPLCIARQGTQRRTQVRVSAVGLWKARKGLRRTPSSCLVGYIGLWKLLCIRGPGSASIVSLSRVIFSQTWGSVSTHTIVHIEPCSEFIKFASSHARASR